MKRLIFIFCLTVAYSVVFGQDNKLIYSKVNRNAAERTAKVLQESDAYISIDLVGIDLEKIPTSNQFVLQFGKQNLTIQKDRIEERGVNNFNFSGKNKEGVNVFFTVLNNDIQGIIETQDAIFSIKTIGKDEYAIVKVDQSKMVEACAHIDDEHHGNQETIVDSGSFDFNNNVSDDLFATRTLFECRVRVLVLYTPAARGSVFNINNTILASIDDANQSFINSNINYRLELAYAGLTSYTEALPNPAPNNNLDPITTDLNRFRNKNDGYMDEVHSLRDKYSADVCVLLARRTDWCGLAKDVGVSEEDAFCLVDVLCAVDNHSFAHEIGHLLGCRHDTYVDNSSKPFAHGHGYVYSPGNWRTIMA